jgi:hypothetical protein
MNHRTTPEPGYNGDGRSEEQYLDHIVNAYLAHKISLEEALAELKRLPNTMSWWDLQVRLYLIRLYGQRSSIRRLTVTMVLLVVLVILLLVYILILSSRIG